MNNDRSKIKFFRIGEELDIYPAFDVDGVKATLLRIKASKALMKQLDAGDIKLVSPDTKFLSEDGKEIELAKFANRILMLDGQIIPGQIMTLSW